MYWYSMRHRTLNPVRAQVEIVGRHRSLQLAVVPMLQERVSRWMMSYEDLEIAKGG